MARFGNVYLRVLVTVAIALMLQIFLHTSWAWIWAGAYAAAQFLELVLIRMLVRRPGTRRGRILCAVVTVMPVITSTIFGFTALPLFASHERFAPTLGGMLLAGALLNVIVVNASSRSATISAAAPHVVYLLIVPFIARATNPGARLADALWLGVLLLIVSVAVAGRTLERALAAEAAAKDEAERRRHEAEEAVAAKSAFVAMISHELRTPISAILAGAHVIHGGDRPENTPETAQLIMDAGRLMTGMLNDLLDHSKIEARAMSLDIRDFDLSAFIDETVRFWSPPASEKGLTLDAPASVGAIWLKGDPFRLRQIVNNLMSNALKFTPAGRISLELVTAETANGVDIRLTVRDQGAGISPEAMDRLFTPFAQGSAQVARTYGGTGLGLAVSRDLARLMGGDLVVESGTRMDAHPGAAFTLHLVLPRGIEAIEAAGDMVAAPALARCLRVLAVDDHEINRRTLALVLQPLDVDLSTASDGASALELLAIQPFDAVLMDVNMPGIDGNETTRRLRASEGPNVRVSVIGFSAGTEAEQIAACRAAGMTDWLAKPLEPARLYEALERATRAEGGLN